MNDFMRAQARTFPSARPMDMSVDAGLRAFMLGVYNKMALGLVVSGLLAFAATMQPLAGILFAETARGIALTPVGWAVQFAPLVALFGAMFMMKNPSPTGANLLYWFVVSMIGLGLGVVLMRYTGESVARTFFITAAAFGALSLWGYTTKKDLSGFGTFLIMGVFGLIIAGVVNIFLQSSLLAFAISGLGVLIFSGLIAYDTQRLKFEYYELQGDGRSTAVATTFGALSLYLNFVNLFQFLMMFLGQREE